MAPEASDDLRKAFRAFDVNDDGVVELSEIALLLQALDATAWTDENVQEFVKHADMNDDGILQYDELVNWLSSEDPDAETILALGLSLADTCPPSMRACRYGESCYNRNPAHRRHFWHPDHAQLEGRQRHACKFGAGCFRRSRAHLEVYVHPGDRNYRKGLVVFRGRQQPQFETVEQAFEYFDEDESGYLAKETFAELLSQLCELGVCEDLDVDREWAAADGEASGYLNFARVAAWASGGNVNLPLGFRAVSEERPCRFRILSRRGWSCPCEKYEADQHGLLCQCGHKSSAHRADIELETAGVMFGSGLNWTDGATGLVEVDCADLLARVQELLEASHKTEDNWTRDRGCTLHGRGHPDCSMACIRKHGNKVPTGYQVKRLFRNQNQPLWNHYALMKKQILADLAEPCDVAFEAREVRSNADLDAPLSFSECNEWRLFHGTSFAACQGISATNFRLTLSGTGATWKEPGAEKGSPLYGYGIYLAESITKSDEYAGETEDGLNCVLICRAVGGRSNLCTTNEIDKQKLKDDVFNGQYHSVFGDRVVTLGKPYREIVLYDKDQIYPEFVVYYERLF